MKHKVLLTSVIIVLAIVISAPVFALAGFEINYRQQNKTHEVSETVLAKRDVMAVTYNSNSSVEDHTIADKPYDEMTTEELAYCILAEVPEEWRDKVLAARNEIINSTSWTVDGAGAILHSDGTIEELPDFYDLFPQDWDIPTASIG